MSQRDVIYTGLDPPLLALKMEEGAMAEESVGV